MVYTPADRLVCLEADGVMLREYRSSDEADLLAAFADHDIARWNPAPAGHQAAVEFMSRRNDWTKTDHASWAVADAADRLVGSVSLHKIDADQADAEIGYWTAPWARRQGHATRAVVTASRFAFSTLGLHRRYLFHAVDNPHSCAVARAAGFAPEGTLRQSYRYADGIYTPSTSTASSKPTSPPPPSPHERQQLAEGGRYARSSSATVVGEAVQVRRADGEARYGSRAAETALSSAVKAGRSCLAVVCRISRSTDQ